MVSGFEINGATGQGTSGATPLTYARSRRFAYEVARIHNGRCSPSFLEAPYGLPQIVEFAKEKAAQAGLPIEFVGWQIDHRTLVGPDRYLFVEQLFAAGRLEKSERIQRQWHFTGEPPVRDIETLQEILRT